MFKKILASILVGMFMFAGAASAMVDYTYSDVDTDTDYFDSIYWAVEHGIATGYGDGRWGPDECVRRAELMKMVMEFEGGQILTTDQPSTFSDVKMDDWFFNYVSLAHAYGYIDGYPDGTFQPNRCVNRAEAMKIAVNVLVGSNGLDSSGGPVMYDDKLVEDISIGDWFGPYARILFKNRLIGTNHTIFANEIAGTRTIKFFPGDSMTRKEVAEMMHRISKYISERELLI
jgi:S-layer homology domain